MSSSDDVIKRTVAIVLAGGKGTRLEPLTRNICKPALSFGGAYRCIDFSLSNCVNSGLGTIGVATQHQPDALLAHLWSHWNSVALGDEVIVNAWRAEERAARFGYRGTADAVYRNLPAIRRLRGSLVLVLAGDHVYRMDYRPILAMHAERQAAVTIASIEAPVGDARHFGVLAVRDDGLIERLVEKPRSPSDAPRACEHTVIASMGVYVFDGTALAEALEDDAQRPDSGHDFGCDVLPRLIDAGGAYSYPFRAADGAPGYWRDIGTLDSYWRAQMELLGPAPSLDLADRTWPIGRVGPPPQIVGPATPMAAGGTSEDSIIAADCAIAGHVRRSVLSPRAHIGRRAQVAESVVLPGAVIGAGSRLYGVIVDAGCIVPDGTVIERRRGTSAPPVLTVDVEHRTARHATSR